MMKNLFYTINKYIFNSENIILGRWCHINVPKCNHDTILKKIDFANSDNNLSIATGKTNKYSLTPDYNPEKYTPQEYIDRMYN